MEKTRKRFSIEDFIDNNSTPVETRDGKRVIIYSTTRPGELKVIGDVVENEESMKSLVWNENGMGIIEMSLQAKYDLFFAPKKIIRRMTNQELSWWLRDCPHEHREWKSKDGNTIYSTNLYNTVNADEECCKDILIRSNGGEWKQPEIEEGELL